jgi:hypothetical protein
MCLNIIDRTKRNSTTGLEHSSDKKRVLFCTAEPNVKLPVLCDPGHTIFRGEQMQNILKENSEEII